MTPDAIRLYRQLIRMDLVDACERLARNLTQDEVETATGCSTTAIREARDTVREYLGS
ncbi:hypothetical protein [Halalkalicoccus jeotgali]|uniref:hypothetical protein n=1 Tax=Halalkalicoccus jeotgali TaxID=413810 RepID=UPI000B1EBAEA|nr:hypothetical protein [Halalkalicoccus jeotgali]